MSGPERPERIPLDLDLPLLHGLEEEAAYGASELGYCLVTGGAGYLGRNLALELIRRGATVRIFDRLGIDFSHERLDFVRGDIREYEDVRKACEGIETVFHTAAVMSFLGFATTAEREESFSVNVGGVANLLRACHEVGVKRLVYTSTNNVTFGGPLLDGDESSPYAEDPQDLYTQSKILGETLALAANGSGDLLTCAIRPGGIYGPNDRLLLTRLVEECARGSFKAVIGDGTAESENSFIENLVDGEIEAARHLIPGSPVCGEAYFITDGVHVNYFDFVKPFVEGMGFEFPKLRIPAAPLYALATVWEFLHWAIRIPPPILTRLEVRKLTVSHYSRIDKARRDFGWVPKVGEEEAREKCIAYCMELLARRERVDRPHWGWWVAILSGMALLGILAFDGGAYALWSDFVTSWTPRWLLQGVFVWAVMLHAHKGMKAVRTAERAGLRKTSVGWGWQTLALGFPSLSLLEKRVEPERGSGDREWIPAWEFSFPNNRRLLAAITAIHRRLYLWTDGRIGHGSGKKQFLLLKYVGRNTGRNYVTPLLYVPDGEHWVVVASNAGDEKNPAWWVNLQSRPEARIQLRDRHLAVEARPANQEECERLWPRLIASYRSFAKYRERTKRQIPIVILEAAE
jgi:3beta-hydroxy-delta5-steroid dehydrogenase/steroid delta-isomerase